jgi:hypothetical protein
MVVLNLTITASTEQVISGIPRFITLSTNISATIFYTIDGTIPTLFSNIYTGSIQLPLGSLSITLQVFATNGVQTTPIITQIYQTDEVDSGLRLPHAGTNAPANSVQGIIDPYPLGSPPAAIQPPQVFQNSGNVGLNVNDPTLPINYSEFDANGNVLPQSNFPFAGIAAQQFPLQQSETDAEGQRGRGIGTLPQFTTLTPPAPPELSHNTDALFDPRAKVIYQDFTQLPDPTLPVAINRQFFTAEDPKVARTGAYYFSSNEDMPPPSGAFLRQHFNPSDGTTTFYYYDNWNNSWIISKTIMPDNSVPNLWSDVKFGFGGKVGTGRGSNKVFQWVPFKGSVLM